VSFVNETDHHGDRTRDVTLQVGIPEVIYSFPLDTDPGWQTEGQWAFGQPTGQGGQYGNPDPTSGYTGPNVYGYNLNGDYELFLPETNLTTTAIDCSNLGHVTLRFRRWLGVRDVPDHAYIRISTDGDFFLYKWFNESEVYDGDWQLVEYDISSYVDGEPTVYIQWTMGPMSGFGTACGWNIDDVEILGVEQGVPCTADLDGSGGVSVNDFLMLLGAWGTDGPGADLAAPTNVVDISDFLALLEVWGGCP
jgi:hypothetical protein